MYSAVLLDLAVALGGAEDGEQVARAVASTLSRALDARAVVALTSPDGRHLTTLWVAEPGGAGGARALGDVVLDRPGPIADALRRQEPVEIASVAAWDGAYPDRRDDPLADGQQACTAVALRSPGLESPLGALLLCWPSPRHLAPQERTLVAAGVAMASQARIRLRLMEQQASDRFRSGFEAMLDDVAMGRAVRDASGQILDFLLEYVNARSEDGAGRRREDLEGRLVCDLYPAWRESGMFERFCRVVETGEPFAEDRIAYADVTPDGQAITGYWNLAITRLDDGYIACSRDVTAAVEAERQASRARAEEERARAAVQALQEASLPPRLPAPDGWDLGAVYQPAEALGTVGGDWYDAFALACGRIGIVLGDVAGHGIDAAAAMVQVRNIVRALAHQFDDPGAVLDRTAELALRLLERTMITCCYAVLDPASGVVEWASAGHLPPVHAGGGEVRLLAERPGPPLMVPAADRHHPSRAVPLAESDVLVLYTDGLVERRGRDIDAGLDELRARVADGRHLPAADLAARLVEDRPARTDDGAVFVLRRLRTAAPR